MIEHSQPSWGPTREPRSWPTSTGGIFARRSSAFTTGFWMARESTPLKLLNSPRLPRQNADKLRGLANSAQFRRVLDLPDPGSAIEDSARCTVARMASATRRADIGRQFA